MYYRDSQVLQYALTQIKHVNSVPPENPQLSLVVKRLLTDETVLFWFIWSLGISWLTVYRRHSYWTQMSVGPSCEAGFVLILPVPLVLHFVWSIDVVIHGEYCWLFEKSRFKCSQFGTIYSSTLSRFVTMNMLRSNTPRSLPVWVVYIYLFIFGWGKVNEYQMQCL